MTRVLVCGGRDFSDKAWLTSVMDRLHEQYNFTTVIDGMARGADALASEWAYRRNVKNERYPADWNKHGKAAGMIRNREMLEKGKPDMVVACPGGRGTAGMVRLAVTAGIIVKKLGAA